MYKQWTAAVDILLKVPTTGSLFLLQIIFQEQLFFWKNFMAHFFIDGVQLLQG